MKTTTKASPELVAAAVAHWEREAAAAQAQIDARTHPQHDRACRRYIAECRRYARNITNRNTPK